MELPEKMVYRKIVQTGQLAEKLGAKMLGLGAFTSVVGDAGITIASHLEIPVTTGDSYTVAVAVLAILQAAGEMRIPVEKATAAVVGGTGAIGQVCAQLLAGHVAELYLIGRDRQKAEKTAAAIQSAHPRAKIIPSVDVNDLKKAEMILTVTSDTDVIIHSEHLKPGSVICDVSRPRDVSPDVAAKRPDILVIDGGVVDVPGPVNFNFDFGFPPGKAYACMAETIALALEGRYENYTLGKQISLSQVEEIDTIAAKHGFRLSGFRSFEKSISAEHIERTWQFAQSAVQSS